MIFYDRNASILDYHVIEKYLDLIATKLEESNRKVTIRSFNQFQWDCFDWESLGEISDFIYITSTSVDIKFDLVQLIYHSTNIHFGKSLELDQHGRKILDPMLFEFEGAPLIDFIFDYINNSVKKARVRISMDVDHVGFDNLSALRVIHDLSKFSNFQMDYRAVTKYCAQFHLSYRMYLVKHFAELLYSLNLNADFFFMFCDTRTKFDSGYQYSPQLYELISYLRDLGHRIGFHPSYYTYSNPSIWGQEFEKYQELVGSQPTIVRSHYLRCNYDNYYNLLKKHGVKEDHSIGMSSSVGYYCGISSGFSPYDQEERDFFKFLSFPLNYMDDFLFSEPEQLRIAKSRILENQRVGFDSSILFHNSGYVLTNDFKEFVTDVSYQNRV